MYTAIATTHGDCSTNTDSGGERGEMTIDTRLWIEEHNWLFSVLTSEHNVSPTFRLPDLISACVSITFALPDASARIFTFLGAELVLRDPHSPRRRDSMWKEQYRLLLDLQRSPANRHPNPKFQLDQLTTTCVALCRQGDPSGEAVLHQSRINMAKRTGRAKARNTNH